LGELGIEENCEEKILKNREVLPIAVGRSAI
jgi:hypothetical protein